MVSRSPSPLKKGFPLWQILMALGVLLWGLMEILDGGARGPDQATFQVKVFLALLQLGVGVLILQGACEALVQSVEHLGNRLRWDTFVAGTIAEMLGTLPEFVVIIFLVLIDPVTAFTVAFITLYNNSLILSAYGLFIPRTEQGTFRMPDAVTLAGTELLIAGAGMVLIIGLAKITGNSHLQKDFLQSTDLFAISAVLFFIFFLYIYTLIRYHAARPTEKSSHTADTEATWSQIGGLFLIGLLGSLLGGDAVSAFADDAIHSFNLHIIPTAILLAFFAGLSELIMIYKAHSQKKNAIALSSAFGGVTGVMFLVVPFTLATIAAFGAVTGNSFYRVPVNFHTTTLVILVFPVFFILIQYLREKHTFSILQVGSMVGIYSLLFYILIAW